MNWSFLTAIVVAIAVLAVINGEELKPWQWNCSEYKDGIVTKSCGPGLHFSAAELVK